MTGPAALRTGGLVVVTALAGCAEAPAPGPVTLDPALSAQVKSDMRPLHLAQLVADICPEIQLDAEAWATEFDKVAERFETAGGNPRTFETYIAGASIRADLDSYLAEMAQHGIAIRDPGASFTAQQRDSACRWGRQEIAAKSAIGEVLGA